MRHWAVFDSRPLPSRLIDAIAQRLAVAHAAEPFSPLEPRQAVRRVSEMLERVGEDPVVYRGALGLVGVEVDHLWLAVRGHVIDVAFPLLREEFLTVLPGYVAGDVPAEALLAAADDAGLEARVLGSFPREVRYLGRPVWVARN